MTLQNLQAIPFEDTIDGYFPLQVSLGQMMERQGLNEAWVHLQHLPIMQIPSLAPTAPVPLNIAAGRAGLIDDMVLRIGPAGEISGAGSWRWFASTADSQTLDPMTRLAEPAYLQGMGIGEDHKPMGQDICLLNPQHRSWSAAAKTPRDMGWVATEVWGPVPGTPGLIEQQRETQQPRRTTQDLAEIFEHGSGQYLLCEAGCFRRDKPDVPA